MGVLQVLLALTYPVLVYFGLQLAPPRVLAGAALGVVAMRVAVARRDQWRELTSIAGAPVMMSAALLMLTALWNDPVLILLSPALVSLGLLCAFGRSLLAPQCLVERIARLQIDSLGAAETRYCRRVTMVWCVYFACNAGLAGGLAFGASREAWLAYTGALAYVPIGLLLGGEYLYRHWRFRRYLGGPLDPWLVRWFPPRDPESLEAKAVAAPARLDPERLAERVEPTHYEIDVHVPPSLACWPGHFPGQPVLPGVVELRWVLLAFERWRGCRAVPRRLEALKYKRLVRPGERLTIRLDAEPGAARFAFRVTVGEQVAAQGRVELAAPEANDESAAETRA